MAKLALHRETLVRLSGKALTQIFGASAEQGDCTATQNDCTMGTVVAETYKCTYYITDSPCNSLATCAPACIELPELVTSRAVKCTRI